MRKVISFEEWVANKAEKEISIKILVTYRILQSRAEIKTTIARLLSDALACHLTDEGLRLIGNGELFSEQDSVLRAKEIGVFLDTLNGELPIEYVNFAFTHWEKEYQARIDLQNRSLWGMLKWVIKRSWLKWHKNYNPEAFCGG